VPDAPLAQDAAGVGFVHRHPAGGQLGCDLAARGGGELIGVQAGQVRLDLLALGRLAQLPVSVMGDL
jgi:hypothetical protein